MKPIIGDVIPLSKDNWASWTEGKPQVDWSALDTSADKEHTFPNQLHPRYASASQKGYNYHKTGLEEKFRDVCFGN